jgi:hypothetical protein
MVRTYMKPLMRNTTAILIFLSMFVAANGQEPDSSKATDSIEIDSGAVQVTDSVDELSSFQTASQLTASGRRSPTGALLRSMAGAVV